MKVEGPVEHPSLARREISGVDAGPRAASSSAVQTAEPGILRTGPSGEWDVPIAGIANPFAVRSSLPSAAARPSIAAVPAAGTASQAKATGPRVSTFDVNFEPPSEIRVSPPLPLVEFKSVVRLDPPAN